MPEYCETTNKSLAAHKAIVIPLSWLTVVLASFNLMVKVVAAETLTLESLNTSLNQNRILSGRFLQCTRHGGAVIKGSGDFSFYPSKKLVLNFQKPGKRVLIFDRHGVTTNDSRGGQKKLTYNYLDNLFFSLANLQPSKITNNFEPTLTGSLQQFSLYLTPKNKLKRTLKSVLIRGDKGLTQYLEIVTKDRILSVHLFYDGQPIDNRCE